MWGTDPLMPDSIRLTPCGPLAATIRPPGSKSITNRALICAALADGKSVLRGALNSEDTRVMIDSLQKVGVSVESDDNAETLYVEGGRGKIAEPADLYVANSGTTIRFLTAMLAGAGGPFRLDGIARMRERPIADLIDALRQLGADIAYDHQEGFPPVVVRPSQFVGGEAKVRGDISSQFLTGLLLAAPNGEKAVTLVVDGELVSKPYIEMTLGVMESFGVQVSHDNCERFVISSEAMYQPTDYSIEPDASAASYFWGAAAVCGGRVTVTGLHRQSLQGDVAFCECLQQMGCTVDYHADSITVTGDRLRGIEVNMNAISDTVQTLAVVALYADGPTRIHDVAHIRHKETDRIGDLARELRKLGALVDEFDDGLKITPQTVRSATLDTYNDHRMAMSFSLAALRTEGVEINDPDCTRKTYPKFFDDLRSITKA